MSEREEGENVAYGPQLHQAPREPRGHDSKELSFGSNFDLLEP